MATGTCDFSLKLLRETEDAGVGTRDELYGQGPRHSPAPSSPDPGPDPYLRTQRQATSLAASSGTGQVGKIGLSRYVAKTSATMY